MLAGKEASMDGQTFLCCSSRAGGGGGCERWHVVQPSGKAIRSGHQYRYSLGEARTGDRQRCARQDGRAQAQEDFGRAPGLATAADQGWRLHLARARRRTRGARPERGLPASLGVRPCREAEFQKKAWWLANAIVPISRGGGPSGQGIKIALSLSA